MRDLIGYLKKIVYLFSFLPLFLLLAHPISAQENFKIYTSFEHTVVGKKVSSEVILQITASSPKVISYYTASIPIKNLDVKCFLVRTGKEIDCTTYHRGSTTDILFELGNSVVKPDYPLEIQIVYSTEIDQENAYSIYSKVLDTTTNLVLIKYEKEMGEPLWTSEPLSNIKTVKDSYVVTISKPIYQSVSLLFGENILYNFTVNRTFQNSTLENQTFELLLPPDSKDQTIVWTEMSPLPNSSVIDDDGNYIFKYIVQPGKTVDCKINGYIEKLSSSEKINLNSFLTKESGYWKIVDSSEEKRITSYMSKKGVILPDGFESVEELDGVTMELFYKNLYKYVVEKLSYEKNLQLGIKDGTRLGAETLVESPQNAKQIDYADFYIALLRKYNIPSRMIVGYVSKISGYTSDGFYHYWIEFYDYGSKEWITADPFLEEYLNKDLYKNDFYDHITILRRGKSTVSPNITFYSDTDFLLDFVTKDDIERNFEPKIEMYFEKFKSTDKYLKGYIYITNNGNLAINSSTILSSNIIDISKYIDPVNNISSQVILPKQNAEIQLNIPYDKISSTNIFLTMKMENSPLYFKDVVLESSILESVPLYIVLTSKFLSITVFLLSFFLVYFIVKIIKKKWIIR